MLWCDKYGNSADCKGSTKSATSVDVVQDDPNNSPITLRMGLYFVHYKFVVPIEASASISKFWFEVDEHNGTSATVYNNGGDDYVVPQDQVIFVPTLSTALFRSNGSYTKTYTNRNGEAFTKVYNLTVAVRCFVVVWFDHSPEYLQVREGSNPSRVYASVSDSAIRNFTYPVNTTIDFTRNSSIPSVGGYDFYSGTVEDTGFQTILDIYADVGGKTYVDDFRQTTFLDNTPYLQPADVGSRSTSSSPAFFVVAVPRLVFGLLLVLLPLHIL